jgi:L-fuconolactonase
MTDTIAPPNTFLKLRDDWLALNTESPIDEHQEIIDAHHHFWYGYRGTYLLQDYLKDVALGHNILSSVYIECRTMWRSEGEGALQSLGETQFVAGTAAMSESGDFGKCRAASAIVAFTDLREGRTSEILEKHLAISDGRVRGIRQSAPWDPDPNMRSTSVVPPRHLLLDERFQAGFKLLAGHKLVFDAWLYHTQLADVVALARKFPETTIVLNHLGGPLGLGEYEKDREGVFATWKKGLSDLSSCDNIVVKLGGLGVRQGFGRYYLDSSPPSSLTLANAWRPWIETVIELFGANRCMFESNFPVDKGMYPYSNCWNAFQRLTASASADERADLFRDTARRTYKL